MTPSPASQPALAKQLGRIGIWSGELRFGDAAATGAAATELEALGYGTLWLPGGAGGDIFEAMERMLAATHRIVVASGIVNIWKHEPAEVGVWWRGLSAQHQARVMLGLGISHGPMIGETYGRPLATMRAYLDDLDAEGVPREHMCLAALGPKMLALSRDRTAGAHPYLTTPEHTAQARALIGPDALLAPEQGVILETEPAKAREIAAKALGMYMRLPNYADNWRRLGFSEADVTGPSERLCDALFAWGGPDAVAARIDAHIAAGADHVCLQVIQGERMGGGDLRPVREAWRTLAEALV